MEDKEKQLIKLRFGLCIKKLLDLNKSTFDQNEKQGIEGPNLIKSYGKLATLSGVPKASIIRIVSGKINMSSTTLSAIIETLDLSFSEFGKVYDNILPKELEEYKKVMTESRKSTVSKKNKNRKRK